MLKCALMVLGLVLALCLPVTAQLAPLPDTRPHASNLRFNKLRIGTLVNCATNSFVTGFDPQTSAPVCLALSLSLLTDASTVVTTTSVHKVFNKQNVARVMPLTASGSPLTVSPAPDCDAGDIFTMNAITADLTISAPVCTGSNPEPFQEATFRLLSSTPRVLTWHAIYSAENGLPLPTATTGDGVTYDYFKFVYNSTSAKWGLIATTRGIQRGITTLASSTTYTCNAALASDCEMAMTGAAGTVTIAAPTGPIPANGTKLLLRIMCTNAQTIAMDAVFIGSPNVPITGLTCAANTTRWTMLGAIWSSVLSKWQVMAVN